jgi:hypothetical protein
MDDDIHQRWDIEEKIKNINIFIKSLKDTSLREVTESDMKIIDNMEDIIKYYNNQLELLQ